jgi:hypothetical protein
MYNKQGLTSSAVTRPCPGQKQEKKKSKKKKRLVLISNVLPPFLPSFLSCLTALGYIPPENIISRERGGFVSYMYVTLKCDVNCKQAQGITTTNFSSSVFYFISGGISSEFVCPNSFLDGHSLC